MPSSYKCCNHSKPPQFNIYKRIPSSCKCRNHSKAPQFNIYKIYHLHTSVGTTAKLHSLTFIKGYHLHILNTCTTTILIISGNISTWQAPLMILEHLCLYTADQLCGTRIYITINQSINHGMLVNDIHKLTVTVKCRRAIKAMLLYFNVCQFIRRCDCISVIQYM